MSTITIDAATATSLAGLDSSLAALPRALQSCSRPGPWNLHDVRWTPGDGCRLAYVDAMGDHELFAVEVSGDEWGRYGWRDDTALPALRVAADPDEVARRLELVLGEPVECTVEPERYRPGSRCVLRYDVVGASGRTTFFAKALQPDAYERIVALHAQPAVHENSTGLVAEMVTFWADLNVAVGRAVEGRSASSILSDAAVSTDDKIRLGHDLGDLLARFHHLPVESDTTWSADQHVITLADTMAAVECADPAIGTRLGAVLDSLTATMPAPGTPVLGHGSFRAGQVVVTADGRPVLLDVDEVRHSDREQDLGVALAHLAWQGIRHPQQQEELVEVERALLAAYETTAGEVRPDALRWWKAAGLLQVAVRRFRRLEVSAWSITNQLAEAAEDLLLEPSRPSDLEVDLLDADQAAQALGAASGREVEIDSAELLGAARGRRQVVKYSVRGLDEPATGAVPVIGKQFAQARLARLSFYHLRKLADGPFDGGEFRVPSPIGLAGEHRLLFYRADDGRLLDSLLDGPSGAEGVRSAAEWLARLHTSELRLPRSLSLARELESTRQWTALISREHPEAAERADVLTSRWAAAAKSAAIDAVGAVVPLHKDFHAGHVLVGEHTCVIDLDEARMGDPAFDVAHFCTYLDQLGASHLVDWFLDAYSAASGWVDKGSLAPFRAYTCLKIAKQAVAGSGPFRDVDRAERLDIADAAIARGTSWVDTPWQGWS
jgi:aminoglycoside phosphotransferase (APT) family kinase protein